MNILIDVLGDLLGEGFVPSTARGLLGALTAVSVGLLSLSTWVLVTSSDPLRQPYWGMPLFAASIVVGGTGTFVALLHSARCGEDRRLSLLAAVVGSLAAGLPLVWLAAR